MILAVVGKSEHGPKSFPKQSEFIAMVTGGVDFRRVEVCWLSRLKNEYALIF